jgi:hypothetical protein
LPFHLKTKEPTSTPFYTGGQLKRASVDSPRLYRSSLLAYKIS